ncbi:MAG: ATP-dependent helicase, partial [Bacteroidales bacterium]|nr:ATP-dependent helicase [Bacteroidales bacterium]
RLFYVAITRAQKAVSASYSMSRMRNGKHESNPPSRFLYELDQHCVENPLQKEDAYSGSSFSSGSGRSFGGFGSGRTSGGGSSFGSGRSFGGGSYGSNRRGESGYRYGSSSSVKFEPRRPSFGSTPSRPSPQPSPVVKPTSAPPIIDTDFVPVPMKELYEGERIEHNRFGAGKIIEITGEFPELKAVVDFDDYGRKQLLLKYAKLRPEKR